VTAEEREIGASAGFPPSSTKRSRRPPAATRDRGGSRTGHPSTFAFPSPRGETATIRPSRQFSRATAPPWRRLNEHDTRPHTLREAAQHRFRLRFATRGCRAVSNTTTARPVPPAAPTGCPGQLSISTSRMDTRHTCLARVSPAPETFRYPFSDSFRRPWSFRETLG